MIFIIQWVPAETIGTHIIWPMNYSHVKRFNIYGRDPCTASRELKVKVKGQSVLFLLLLPLLVLLLWDEINGPNVGQ